MFRVAADRAQVAALCERHGIRRLAVFGSAVRDDFSADSDVDVLVEFEPGRTPGFAFWNIEHELASLFGRRVDLQTLGSSSPYFRAEVAREAVDQYVAR